VRDGVCSFATPLAISGGIYCSYRFSGDNSHLCHHRPPQPPHPKKPVAMVEPLGCENLRRTDFDRGVRSQKITFGEMRAMDAHGILIYCA
jgi:hypothetical protein